MKPACFAFVFALSLITIVASAQTDTTFTYQGELKENGSPANGAFDIEFELWNAATGGDRIGNEIENDELPVVNGRFTVELDFGTAAFDNSDRWLEIKVNGGTLSPRVPLTRTPYSIQTRGIVVNENKRVGIGPTGHFLGLGRLTVFTDATVDNWAILGRSEVGSAVEGWADAVNGTGVHGFAVDRNGVNYGVRGTSNSNSGFDFYADGDGLDYGAQSSRRWKSNVVSISQPLAKISRMRGVYFDWDAEHGGHHDIGMIAEEVGNVLPEIVQYEDNGVDARGMDYSKLTPLLVEAVKSLRNEKDAEIGELKQQIKDLRQLVHRLMSEKE